MPGTLPSRPPPPNARSAGRQGPFRTIGTVRTIVPVRPAPPRSAGPRGPGLEAPPGAADDAFPLILPEILRGPGQRPGPATATGAAAGIGAPLPAGSRGPGPEAPPGAAEDASPLSCRKYSGVRGSAPVPQPPPARPPGSEPRFPQAPAAPGRKRPPAPRRTPPPYLAGNTPGSGAAPRSRPLRPPGCGKARAPLPAGTRPGPPSSRPFRRHPRSPRRPAAARSPAPCPVPHPTGRRN
ncbi:hypothetical protein SAMN05444417_0112 [Wenxinia saemankumensis]|uniref:Uncharacterized protein n=1 Tax=Wenxinia saemankumensis TaxID=1447782 RepID=A0A1M6A046_9RHOB|nr:hypothetical protein SAMN05444417_0112 [Wenxinia saemankumensis]